MKKFIQCFLAIILCLGISLMPKHIAKAETRDGISNNSIKFKAYNYPWDLQTEWVEFKFVPQGNGTAKLKYYANGKVLDASHVKRNLTLYYDTYLEHGNIYGLNDALKFGRGQYMYNVAEILENLTFTYGSDHFQIHLVSYVMPPDPPYPYRHLDQGIYGARIEGTIHSNLANRDFNDDLRFSGRRELYQFRVEKDGLYAQYKSQVRIPDGEYVIESSSNSNKVVDVLYGLNAKMNSYDSNRALQKFKLEYNNKYKAYKIRANHKDTVLNWQKTQGNNVDFTSDRNYAEQFWYLENAGNGNYRVVNAKDIHKALDLNQNSDNLEIFNKHGESNQQFKFIKSNEKLGITDGEWKIASKLDNNKVLNLHIGGIDPSNVTIWSNANVTQQRWKFEYNASKKAFKIRNSYNNGNLEWDPPETNVWAARGGDYNAQYWVLEDVGNGYYIFKNYHNPNMVLDLYSSSTSNASNIQVHKRHNGDNQKFKLIR